ncbi:hypothetical protein [Dysgonomonas alginatilytica]|nr:hypothetical protein [Dysgonomonas alginatilytica]
MLENILNKLYRTKETPEILLFRQKVESIAAKLEYLKSMEPQTDEDYLNIPLIVQYAKLTTEINLEIAEIYIADVLE